MSVSTVRIQHTASYRLDEIYHYTLKRWGEAQALRYLQGLFDAFDGVVTHRTHSRPTPAALGVDGFYFRYEQHIIYWKALSNGDVGIATILHVRMHQFSKLRDDFEDF